jgi:hypothetical protein
MQEGGEGEFGGRLSVPTYGIYKDGWSFLTVMDLLMGVRVAWT